MKRLHFSLLAATTLATALYACGGISDPSKGETVATVQGSLTGTTVPAGAHVALVWRNPQGRVEVGADSAIVDGRFAMSLAQPASKYFFEIDAEEMQMSENTASPPPSTSEPDPAPLPEPPAPSGGKGIKAGNVGKLDTVNGQVTQPLSIAIAGFIVYVDKNGNGKLDIDDNNSASSPDQIIGGNKELLLTFLKDGGSLDYEKLRDKSGILPTPGFNLAWSEGRWLPLNVVELKLKEGSRLPSGVCDSASSPDDSPKLVTPGSDGSGDSAGSQGEEPTDPTVPRTGFPSPDEIICAPDGRGFTYKPVDCTPPTPEPAGLCNSGSDIGYGCAGSGPGYYLNDGDPIPEGWPCPVLKDGGPDEDGGAADAGAD